MWAHFAAGYAIAAVVLGVLFLVTATFGTVTDDDVAAAGNPQQYYDKRAVYFYYRDPTRNQMPAFLQLSKTDQPRLVCSITAEAKVDSSSIRVSNRLGRTLQSVLNALEWAVGLFYDVHFPTTLEATAKQVRDPNFGQQNLDVLQPDFMKMQITAMSNPSCDAAVVALLKNDATALVCPVVRFWRLPQRQELLVIGVFHFCLTLPGETQPREIGRHNLSEVEGLAPLLTKIKIKLGVLRAEVEDKSAQ
jgi:hypothetical protein